MSYCSASSSSAGSTCGWLAEPGRRDSLLAVIGALDTQLGMIDGSWNEPESLHARQPARAARAEVRISSGERRRVLLTQSVTIVGKCLLLHEVEPVSSCSRAGRAGREEGGASMIGRGPLSGLPDPDEVTELLDQGYTLPAEFYTDERIAQLEDYWMWQRLWRPIGIVHELKEVGDYLTAKVGSVPVVVVRGSDRELRAFVNICRHRMHIVARGQSGNRKTLQCIYHGWTYGLDGCLRAIPRAEEGEIEFDEFGLVPAAVDTFKGVVYVSVEPREPLTSFLGEAPRSEEHTSELQS